MAVNYFTRVATYRFGFESDFSELSPRFQAYRSQD